MNIDLVLVSYAGACKTCRARVELTASTAADPLGAKPQLVVTELVDTKTQACPWCFGTVSISRVVGKK